jgi:hypothetical protein
VRPPRQELVVVGDAEEEGEVVGDVAALGVDEQVPVGAKEGEEDSNWVQGAVLAR